MGDLKSLHLLWVNLARNQRYCPYVDEKDISTFLHRAPNEGLTFLTVALPSIGRALDRFHSTTEWEYPVDHLTVSSDFQLETREVLLGGRIHYLSIPKFLGKAIQSAIEGDSIAVDCVRQLSYIFYKLEVQHDAETVTRFLVDFKRVDSDLESSINFVDHFSITLIDEMRRTILRILQNEDPLDIRPSHGSGATACHTANWDKYHKLRYFPKLDACYPYSDYFFYNFTHLVDEMKSLEDIDIMSDPRARVVLVPKDSRGPRIISCEPAELMYIQQGIMKKLYAILETNYLTRGQLNFADQGINRELARSSSIDGIEATLDLSEASDRVSLQLVRLVFPARWVECLEACRSEETILPNGEIIKLNKFAPMGSSCCFPVEALVFWACARASQQILSPSSRGRVFVYGDDIIVPSLSYDDVVRGLTAIGLKVNLNKSYKSGPFRESCGGDYHNGYDVTPVRVRKIPTSKSTGIATNADLVNDFIAKFGSQDSISLIRVIEDALGYQFPRTLLSLPGTIRLSPSASNDAFYRRRWNTSLQRYEHRILCLSSKALAKQPPNWGELLRMELTKGSQGSTSDDSYVHWTKPLDAKLKPGQYTETHSAQQKWDWVWLG